MSRKTRLLASLASTLARMGGSHLTREARRRTAEKFADSMFEQGFTHLADPQDIAGRHLRAYVHNRLKEKPAVRSVQNEMAHIRSILKVGGNRALAETPDLSNRSLGISGGSRRGTKTAMADADLNAVRELALRQNRPGLAAMLLLERYFGLRGGEAIHARSDTLARWERELAGSGRIRVIAGTKGGKPRDVQILNIGPARTALQEARLVADSQDSYLVARADGSPAGGLKEARSIYHAWCHRSGIQPHSARYAFAQDQIKARRDLGHSEREALVATSLDLGHGDGRGRWVKSVYAQ